MPTESWLSHNLGSIVLAVAAVAGASLAAFVAIWNRRKELEHDRYLTNQEHIRTVIDATVIQSSATQTLVGDFLSYITVFEADRTKQQQAAQAVGTSKEQEKLDKWEREAREKLEAEREKTRPKLQELMESSIRLSIRLPLDDPIVLTYEKAYQAANALFLALSPGVTENRSEDSRKADKALNKARHEASRAFRDACRAWFNVDPPPRGFWKRLAHR